MTSEVRFPQRRQAILEEVAHLADPDYQRRIWVECRFPAGYYDSIHEMIHTLWDDTNVASDPRSEVGLSLVNVSEAEALGALTTAIDDVLGAVGQDAPAQTILESHLWPEVVESAARALSIMRDATDT